jgi:NTE family protein
MKKINDMGILEKVDVLSTISGGSITGAAWCIHSGGYQSFHDEMAQKLQNKSVIRYVLCSKEIILGIAFMVVFGLGPIALTFTNGTIGCFLR